MTKLDIYLCVQEDKSNLIQHEIFNYILMQECFMQVKCVVSQPQMLLNQISFSKNPNIYILEMGSNREYNQEFLMQLKILNPSGIAILIGTDIRDYVTKNSKYMLEIKWIEDTVNENIISRILSCLNTICDGYKNNYYKNRNFLCIQSEGTHYLLKPKDIYFVETKKLQHKVIIHLENRQLECNLSLGEINQYLEQKEFYQCHRSAIVNIEHISKVDAKERIIYMRNREQLECSIRCMKMLIEKMNENQFQN